MPALTAHHSLNTTKLLLIGESGSGKTGALASLAAAGYNLRIIDLDNGLDVLKEYLTNPKSRYVQAAPNVAERVRYITATDTMKNVAGNLYAAKATAWPAACRMLDHWKDGDEDLGKITTWGERDILVIDTLTKLSTAAMNHHLAMNMALGQVRTQNEGRRDIGAAQKLITSMLEMLYDSSVKCNVIVNSHITFTTEGGVAPKADEKTGAVASPQIGQGYPASIGRALGPHIPRFFNSMLVVNAVGTGMATRRRIFTVPQTINSQTIMSKSSAPLSVAPEYPIETGLADYFKAVRGGSA